MDSRPIVVTQLWACCSHKPVNKHYKVVLSKGWWCSAAVITHNGHASDWKFIGLSNVYL